MMIYFYNPILQGACILNMLQDYIGTEGFEAGIINYLQRFSYRNAQNQDLWDSITDVSSLDFHFYSILN